MKHIHILFPRTNGINVLCIFSNSNVFENVFIFIYLYLKFNQTHVDSVVCYSAATPFTNGWGIFHWGTVRR